MKIDLNISFGRLLKIAGIFVIATVLTAIIEYYIVKQLDNQQSNSNYVSIVPKSTPFSNAFSYYGQNEKDVTGKSNPVILGMLKEFASWVRDTETPWCSAFMNYTHAQAGYPYTSSLSARSWLKIGKKVKEPKLGDVVVLWRGSKTSWQGHVGYFLSYSNNKKEVLLYGGNQNNSVSIQRYASSRVLDFIRIDRPIHLPAAYEVISLDSILYKQNYFENEE